MPSLFGASYSGGVDVGANYGRMVPQQTYGIGENQTNFGTRQLALISVAVSGGTNDMRYQDGATSSLSYNLSNSLYSKAVRTLQQYAEVYAVYTPVAGGFCALIALDTANSSESGNGVTTGAIATTYGIAEAAIAAALNSSASVTITVPTIAPGASL